MTRTEQRWVRRDWTLCSLLCIGAHMLRSADFEDVVTDFAKSRKRTF